MGQAGPSIGSVIVVVFGPISASILLSSPYPPKPLLYGLPILYGSQGVVGWRGINPYLWQHMGEDDSPAEAVMMKLYLAKVNLLYCPGFLVSSKDPNATYFKSVLHLSRRESVWGTEFNWDSMS